MTNREAEIQSYLEDNGYSPHFVAGGSRALLDRWQNFVNDVESGYPYTLFDYRNDLDIRSLLRLFELDSEAAAEDARLDAMLIHREIRIWESGDGNPPWDFGFPRNAGRFLLRDLASAGLLPSKDD